MKTLVSSRKVLAILLVLLLALSLSACGYEKNLDLTDISNPVFTENIYVTEAELATKLSSMSELFPEGLDTPLGEIPPEYADMTVAEYIEMACVAMNCKPVYTPAEFKGASCFKFTTESLDPDFQDTEGATNLTSFTTPIITATSKKVEVSLFDNFITSYSSSYSEMSTVFGVYELNVTTPFKIYYTNGEKTGKKTITFGKEFANGEERCVAVSSKKVYNYSKIKVKGVKNNKTYKVGKEMTVSSKNAIKVFTINGENIADNSYIFDEPGEYKIKIVLANDTTKELNIKIK